MWQSLLFVRQCLSSHFLSLFSLSLLCVCVRESSRAVVAFWFALFCLFSASVAYFDSDILVFFFLVAGSAREDENYNCVKNKLIFLVAVAAFLCVSCLAYGNYVLFADCASRCARCSALSRLL